MFVITKKGLLSAKFFYPNLKAHDGLPETSSVSQICFMQLTKAQE